MDCIPLDQAHLPALSRLVNRQIAHLPPGWALTAEQVGAIVASPDAGWAPHYPGDSGDWMAQAFCVIDADRISAAGQVGCPPPSGNPVSPRSGVLHWIVSDGHSPDGIRVLLDAIVTWARTQNVHQISVGRYAFGVGWMGIPVADALVVTALQGVGFTLGTRWRLWVADSRARVLPQSRAADAHDQLELTVNAPAGEWTLTCRRDGQRIAECEAWAVPEQYLGCPDADEWITLEWLGVEPPHQGQGIGRRLLAEQMRLQTARGIRRFVLWSEPSNQAMSHVASGLGFEPGPEVMELHLSLQYPDASP